MIEVPKTVPVSESPETRKLDARGRIASISHDIRRKYDIKEGDELKLELLLAQKEGDPKVIDLEHKEVKSFMDGRGRVKVNRVILNHYGLERGGLVTYQLVEITYKNTELGSYISKDTDEVI